VRGEPEIVRAVLATLASIVAADDAHLTVRSYDPRRRRVELVLSTTRRHGPDAVLIWEFLADVLCRHGIWLDEVRVETDAGAAGRPVPGSRCASHAVRVRRR
jgi:hypothetical protein